MALGPENEGLEKLSGRERLNNFLRSGNRDERVRVLEDAMLSHCVISLQDAPGLTARQVTAVNLFSDLSSRKLYGTSGSKPEGDKAVVMSEALDILRKYNNEAAGRMIASGMTVFFNNALPYGAIDMFKDMEVIEAELK